MSGVLESKDLGLLLFFGPITQQSSEIRIPKSAIEKRQYSTGDKSLSL
jgi:hypothetical protein